VRESAESWFWHTADWLAFAKAIGAEFFIDDLSALIYVDRDPIAVCPVILEERQGYRRFSYFGDFIPCPAFGSNVTESARLQAIEFYADWLDTTAAQRNVAYTRVFVPPLAACRASSRDAQAWNPLLRHGYLDISGASQVIDLTPDVEQLWRNVRKGHRSDIKRAAGQCEARVWDAATVTDDTFDRYRTLHAIDAGRVTRTRETFDMMLAWIRAGHGVLVEAHQGDRPVAFAVVITFRGGAYYASSCKDPQVPLPSMHLVQWETIKWLKDHGVQRYDIGGQYFGPTWSHLPSEKELSIAHFKRGFGGTTRRVDTVEKFYSAALLKQLGGDRLQALLAGREQHTR
jgi:Acetyltransferase (GNAT) domain